MPAIGARTTAGSTTSAPSFSGAIVVVTSSRVGGSASSPGPPGPGSQQPAPVLREPDGLGPVAGAGLADRRGEVVAHRALGQVQRRGEVGDRVPAAGGPQHLRLPRG